jgi:hypothetical protein
MQNPHLADSESLQCPHPDNREKNNTPDANSIRRTHKVYGYHNCNRDQPSTFDGDRQEIHDTSGQHTGSMTDTLPEPTGLDAAGYITREGSLQRVTREFTPVTAAAGHGIRAAYGAAGTPGGLHGAYLYGSVPRGTAVPGVSDLDLLVLLDRPPTEADRAAARALETALNAEFPQVDGVGAVLSHAATVLSPLERHDFGFFVACLCTPLLGADLADRLPGYRPVSLLAKETNGDLALFLPRWRESVARIEQTERPADAEAERRALGRTVARRLVRTGFTLVMPRWGGWTSDLEFSAEIFGHYYPEWTHPGRAAQLRAAARYGRTPSADPAALRMLLDDLGPWLAEEYTSLHGTKAPRP